MTRRFLHRLESAEGVDNYLVGGRIWKGWSICDWDALDIDRDAARCSVRTTNDGAAFTWEYWTDLSTGCRFSHFGSAPTVEDACRAALDFTPESICLEYLGCSFLCYGRPGHNGVTAWIFAVDGEKGEVVGPFDYSNGDRFSWRREWRPAKELLDGFCDTSGGLRGTAPSMMEALIAAVDAPELFKRACGRMIATLSEGDHA